MQLEPPTSLLRTLNSPAVKNKKVEETPTVQHTDMLATNVVKGTIKEKHARSVALITFRHYTQRQ